MLREVGEDGDSQGDGSSQPDTISIASRTSQNTVDSDKVEHLDELMVHSCLSPAGFPTQLLWERAGAAEGSSCRETQPRVVCVCVFSWALEVRLMVT